jgi:putative membrane protein insertion efficiency factor
MHPATTLLADACSALSRWPQQILLLLVRGYRLLLKPWIGNACRFEPTCSAYSLGALQRHGALKGSALTVGRILRCQPWCDGGHDPVPDHFSLPGAGLFSRLGLTGGDASSADRGYLRGDDIPKTRNLP